MADFNAALKKVLRHEGVEFDQAGEPIPGHTGYVNHPDDPGGETNYGITKAEARLAGYCMGMADMTYGFAASIYREDYWNMIRGDEIPDQQIADELFDTAVNCGFGTVSKFLQRTLNVLNMRGASWPDLKVDGDIGPKTIEALRTALTWAPYYRLCILRAVDSLQCVRYIELAEYNPTFESFVPGWLRARVGVEE